MAGNFELLLHLIFATPNKLLHREEREKEREMLNFKIFLATIYYENAT